MWRRGCLQDGMEKRWEGDPSVEVLTYMEEVVP